MEYWKLADMRDQVILAAPQMPEDTATWTDQKGGLMAVMILLPAATGEAGALLACPDCDLLHSEHAISERMKASCARCGAVLYRCDPYALDRALALTVASAQHRLG